MVPHFRWLAEWGGGGVAPPLSLGSIWRGSRPFKTTSATEHPFCYFCLTSIIHIYGLQIDQYMVRTFLREAWNNTTITGYPGSILLMSLIPACTNTNIGKLSIIQDLKQKYKFSFLLCKPFKSNCPLFDLEALKRLR